MVGCRSAVGNCDVYPREGSDQVLVPSIGIFHLILQICLRHLCLSLPQALQSKEVGSKRPLLSPDLLTTPGQTPQGGFCQMHNRVCKFFPSISTEQCSLQELAQADGAYRIRLARSAPLSREQCIAPACCAAAEQPSPSAAIASGCPASICTGPFDQTPYS